MRGDRGIRRNRHRLKRNVIGSKAGGDYGHVVNIEITANASMANDLAIAPTMAAFACVIEQTSAAIVFTVANLASSNSGTITASIVGGSARDFRVVATDCTIFAPLATCSVQVVCSPPMSQSSATRHAILSVTDGNTQLLVPLSGEVSF